MENIRTKRAKKPNPKYADSDYETIAALRRPFKQAKLDRRSSLLSEKGTPSHDETLNSTSSISEEEDDTTTTTNDTPSREVSSEEDIKVEVGDAEDEAILISNGKESPDLDNSLPNKKEEIASVTLDTVPPLNEVSVDLPNANDTGSQEIEKVLNPDMITSIFRNQVIMNKRLEKVDKIENQVSKILEILQKNVARGQSNIIKIKDPDAKSNNLKKKSNK